MLFLSIRPVVRTAAAQACRFSSRAPASGLSENLPDSLPPDLDKLFRDLNGGDEFIQIPDVKGAPTQRFLLRGVNERVFQNIHNVEWTQVLDKGIRVEGEADLEFPDMRKAAIEHIRRFDPNGGGAATMSFTSQFRIAQRYASCKFVPGFSGIVLIYDAQGDEQRIVNAVPTLNYGLFRGDREVVLFSNWLKPEKFVGLCVLRPDGGVELIPNARHVGVASSLSR